MSGFTDSRKCPSALPHSRAHALPHCNDDDVTTVPLQERLAKLRAAATEGDGDGDGNGSSAGGSGSKGAGPPAAKE